MVIGVSVVSVPIWDVLRNWHMALHMEVLLEVMARVVVIHCCTDKMYEELISTKDRRNASV